MDPEKSKPSDRYGRGVSLKLRLTSKRPPPICAIQSFVDCATLRIHVQKRVQRWKATR
jgi:hypothetical protein